MLATHNVFGPRRVTRLSQSCDVSLGGRGPLHRPNAYFEQYRIKGEFLIELNLIKRLVVVVVDVRMRFIFYSALLVCQLLYTVESQWFEYLWDHGNLFETWVVRATEG